MNAAAPLLSDFEINAIVAEVMTGPVSAGQETTPQKKISKEEAEKLARRLTSMWIGLAPFRELPDVALVLDPIEKLWDKSHPAWRTEFKIAAEKVKEAPAAPGPVTVGILPLILVAALTSKTAIWLGASAAAAVLGYAAAKTVNERSKSIADALEEWKKTRTRPTPPPPPVKDKDGKPIPPWFVAPLLLAIKAAALAGVAAYAVKLAAEKIPKAPKIPKWVIPALLLGAGGYLIYRVTKKKEITVTKRR